jgi:hypothetical protein
MSVAAKRLAGRIARAAMATFGIVLSAMPGAEAQTPFYRASEQEIAGPPGTGRSKPASVRTKAPDDAGALVRDRIGDQCPAGAEIPPL